MGCESHLLADGGREAGVVVEPCDYVATKFRYRLAERGTLQILFEVRNRFHSNQRGSDRQRLRERNGAPCIAVETGECGAKLVRKRPGELRLHKSGASDDRDTNSMRRFQQRNALSANTLGWNAYCLRHSEIDRELDDPEVVVLPSDLTRDSYELLEAQMIPSVGQYSEPVPGGAAVTTNDPTPDLLLQR